jgi:hypothetical protein
VITFETAQSITVTKGQWDLTIDVVDESGELHSFIATAHPWYAGDDGLWFGTQQEYNEYE